MVKRIGTIVGIVLLLLVLSGIQVFSETDTLKISDENTTVQNRLPQVRIFCETTEDYQPDVAVSVNSYQAKVNSAQRFSDLGEGIQYFILVDVSGSIKKKDFRKMQDSLIDFAANEMTDRNQIVLIPFGEKVYYDAGSLPYSPGSGDLTNAFRKLKADDHKTNLYDAIDTVAEIIAAENVDELSRKIVLTFTDGIDNTVGGYKNEEEAPAALHSLGIPLYAFAVGNSKADKDKLGVLARSLNGRLYQGDLSDCLRELQGSLNNTLTIDAEANNAADLGSAFDLCVTVSGQGKDIIKTDIAANKTGREKNTAGYTIRKLISHYWWLLAIIAIAIIAAIVIGVIRKHKGIVMVDGETVFRDNMTSKQRISVKQRQARTLNMTISVNGSNEIVRNVDIVSSIIVGRSKETCDISFEDPAMGRQNFCIELNGDNFFIKDLESTNGTTLNGIKVNGVQQLHPGDIIIAGKTKIIVGW